MNKITQSIREYADEIDAVIADYEHQIADLKEKLSKSEREVESVLLKRAKETIFKLEDEQKLVVATLHSDKELEDYFAFADKHRRCQDKLKINMGKFPYVVQNYVGAGVCTKVCCQICGAEKDITDVYAW